MGEVGVVGGRRRIGSEVFHLVAMFLEPGLELFLHLESGVVGGDGYEFGHLRDGGRGTGGSYTERTFRTNRSGDWTGRSLSCPVTRPPSAFPGPLRPRPYEFSNRLHRRWARRSAATYVGIPISLAISKTPIVVLNISSALRRARSRVQPATSP